jgi:hypothetical protein
MVAAGTLDLAAGKLLVALQMLVALGAGKFEFAHKFQLRSPGRRNQYGCRLIMRNFAGHWNIKKSATVARAHLSFLQVVGMARCAVRAAFSGAT